MNITRNTLLGALTAFLMTIPALAATTTAIPYGSSWKFSDKGTNLGSAWRAAAFNDSAWVSGNAQLGYGNGDEATVVSYGPSSTAKYTTTYFRKTFTVADPSLVTGLTLNLTYDDGAVVYINGVEVKRINMPAGTIASSTFATTTSSNNATTSATLAPAGLGLVAGINTVAVEIHQANLTSSDISFDLKLDLDINDGTVANSATRRYRLIWNDAPATKATLGWEQISGTAATVHYGTEDFGRDELAYPNAQGVSRQVTALGMNNCFTRLTGLQPDTVYYCVIADASGVSPRFKFRTAPNVTTKPFTFIAGGDSRNNALPRQRGNKLVAKLRPLFVAFTGDMTDTGSNAQWQEWMDDWQLTTTPDNRLIPIIAHRGNHEAATVIPSLFDTNTNTYSAMDIGGNMLRYYTLNTEITEGGTQASWLTNDLVANSGRIRHLVAGYHVPMRPHTSDKAEGTGQYNAWATPFYNHGMDLVCESDTHTMKRTQPLKPSASGDEGFLAAPTDPKATVFIGEGCWGAPLRAPDDAKSWTLGAEAFNGFDWVQVTWDKMDIRTLRIDSEGGTSALPTDNSFAVPAGAVFWAPASQSVLTIPGDGGQP